MKEDEKFKGAGSPATNPALHQWSDRTFDLTLMGFDIILTMDVGHSRM